MNTKDLRIASREVFLYTEEEIAHGLATKLNWASNQINQLKDDNQRLADRCALLEKVLGNLLFECDGILRTEPPTRQTYNMAFEVLNEEKV